MARNESDREDLMREATALTRRVELILTDIAEPIVVGFRDSTGWASFYFGQDPVYTFDAEGRLRRAYVDGFLYRTQGTTLARLFRERTLEATHLLRHDLTADELQTFLDTMKQRLQRLDELLLTNRYEVVECIAPEESWRTVGWFADVRKTIALILAQSEPLAPVIPGKR